MILKRFDWHFVPNHCVNPMIKKLHEGTCSHHFFLLIRNVDPGRKCFNGQKASGYTYFISISLHSRLYCTLNNSIPFSHVHTLVQIWIEEWERKQHSGSPPPQSPLPLCIRMWMWVRNAFKKTTGIHF